MHREAIVIWCSRTSSARRINTELSGGSSTVLRRADDTSGSAVWNRSTIITLRADSTGEREASRVILSASSTKSAGPCGIISAISGCCPLIAS